MTPLHPKNYKINLQSIFPLVTVLLVILLVSCRSSGKGDTITTVKPRYHHTWYKKHTYKKKWHIGRIRFRPEKQGVKKVRVKN